MRYTNLVNSDVAPLFFPDWARARDHLHIVGYIFFRFDRPRHRFTYDVQCKTHLGNRVVIIRCTRCIRLKIWTKDG